MNYFDYKPREDNWATRIIKWADGSNTGVKFRGEKWDTMHFRDVDGDGDLDIMANVEENFDEEQKTIVGVVWFENPTR